MTFPKESHSFSSKKKVAVTGRSWILLINVSEAYLYQSVKIGFNSKIVRRDNGRHYIMIKGSIYYKDITTTYVPNIRAHKHVKQIQN